MKVFYSADYNASTYSFDTTRKSKWVAKSLVERPIRGVEINAPASVTEGQLRLIHTQEYIDAVRTGKDRILAESQGFDWDAGIHTAASTSTGGMVYAALHALRDGVAGTLSSGLHHAYADGGAGFCTYNGLALAAKMAIAAGADRVLIVDFDAHCGGGTASLVEDNPRIWQCDVATNNFDVYADTDRCKLVIADDPEHYLSDCAHALSRIGRLAADRKFDLVIYNAGMDPSEDCGVGGLKGLTSAHLAERERLVFEWCRLRGIPVAFTLAGGYLGPNLEVEGLVDLHRLTIEAAAQLSRSNNPKDAR